MGALFERGDARLVGFAGDVHSALHQGNLGGGLDDAAGDDDRIGARESGVRRFLPDPVEQEESHRFFHRDGPAGDAAVAEDLRNELVRALVLLPDANVVSECQCRAKSRFLEAGQT